MSGAIAYSTQDKCTDVMSSRAEESNNGSDSIRVISVIHLIYDPSRPNKQVAEFEKKS